MIQSLTLSRFGSSLSACQSALNCHHHFTAEPEPGPAEQDGHISGPQQYTEEAGAKK